MINKRKATSKIMAFVLALIMLLTPSLTAEAANIDTNDSNTFRTAWKNGEKVTFYNSGNTKVDGYKNGSGDIIFNQYVDGKLVQRDSIRANNKGIVEREFLGSSIIGSGVHNDSIRVSDYVTIKKSGTSTAAVNTVAGTINYRSLSATGYTYYGLRCIYDTIDAGASTYTINEFTGQVVDLIALLIGSFNFPEVIAISFINNLLIGLGITVVDGVINNRVTDTVACHETDYNWTLTDTTASSHSKNVYGGKYYITESKSAVKDNTYYDGYVPKDWKTQALAVWFHDEMFSDLNWEVVSWS